MLKMSAGFSWSYKQAVKNVYRNVKNKRIWYAREKRIKLGELHYSILWLTAIEISALNITERQGVD